ncbi:TPA: ESPR domain-containing protein [Escherichia coli]|nr:ESPR domain-containing protein [Escherichia coli]MCW3382714.1 ESPR domain-containing protein [Escherichia coli]
MNKIYNIVWNESSGMWVVTSELTCKVDNGIEK